MPTGAAFAQRGLCQIGKSSIRLQSSNYVKTATFDRYTTIRAFFRQQHTISLNRAETPCRPRIRATCYSTLVCLHLGVSFGSRRPYSRSAPVHAEGEGKKDAEGFKQTPPHSPVNYDDYPRLFRRLATSLPHLQRPTRDDLLKVATGFWERARIRFKWFTIKSFRKFNADDISAFVTWFVMSQTLWILVGTCVSHLFPMFSTAFAACWFHSSTKIHSYSERQSQLSILRA